MLQLLDGSVSLTDITAALMRESKDMRVGNMVRDFIRQLDDLLMLESPRFQRGLPRRCARPTTRSRSARRRSRATPTRPSARRSRRSSTRTSPRPSRCAPRPASRWRRRTRAPRALLAPHLDPRRAGATIARAYLELGAAPPAPLRVVVLGTGHSLMGDLFALTRKHFQTPLGKLECDTAFVDTLAAGAGRRRLPRRAGAPRRALDRVPGALPAAPPRRAARSRSCPSCAAASTTLLDEGKTPREDAGSSASSRRCRPRSGSTAARRSTSPASTSSHVGPRFGDPRLDERTRAEVEEKDRAALAAAVEGRRRRLVRAPSPRTTTRRASAASRPPTCCCAPPGPGRAACCATSSRTSPTARW